MKLLSIIRIKRLAGFENAISEVQEFAHNRDNDLFGQFTVGLEPLGKSAEQWSVTLGSESGHKQSGAQTGSALPRYVASTADTAPGLMTSGIQADKSHHLSNIRKTGDD